MSEGWCAQTYLPHDRGQRLSPVDAGLHVRGRRRVRGGHEPRIASNSAGIFITPPAINPRTGATVRVRVVNPGSGNTSATRDIVLTLSPAPPNRPNLPAATDITSGPKHLRGRSAVHAVRRRRGLFLRSLQNESLDVHHRRSVEITLDLTIQRDGKTVAMGINGVPSWDAKPLHARLRERRVWRLTNNWLVSVASSRVSLMVRRKTRMDTGASSRCDIADVHPGTIGVVPSLTAPGGSAGSGHARPDRRHTPPRRAPARRETTGPPRGRRAAASIPGCRAPRPDCA